jgi:hypothetical protein
LWHALFEIFANLSLFPLCKYSPREKAAHSKAVEKKQSMAKNGLVHGDPVLVNAWLGAWSKA